MYILSQRLPDPLHLTIPIRALHGECNIIPLGKLDLLTNFLINFLLPDVTDHITHLKILVEMISE